MNRNRINFKKSDLEDLLNKDTEAWYHGIHVACEFQAEKLSVRQKRARFKAYDPNRT